MSKENISNIHTKNINCERNRETYFKKVDEISWDYFQDLITSGDFNLRDYSSNFESHFKNLIGIIKKRGNENSDLFLHLQKFISKTILRKYSSYGLSLFDHNLFNAIYKVLAEDKYQSSDRQLEELAHKLLEKKEGDKFYGEEFILPRRVAGYYILKRIGAPSPPYKPLVELVDEIRRTGKKDYHYSCFQYFDHFVEGTDSESRQNKLFKWAEMSNAPQMIKEAHLSCVEFVLRNYQKAGEQLPERTYFNNINSDNIKILNRGVLRLSYYGSVKQSDDFLELLAENNNSWKSLCKDRYEWQSKNKYNLGQKIDFYNITKILAKSSDSAKFKQYYFDTLSEFPLFQIEALESIVSLSQKGDLPLHYADTVLAIASEQLKTPPSEIEIIKPFVDGGSQLKKIPPSEECLILIKQYGGMVSEEIKESLLERADGLLEKGDIDTAFQIYDSLLDEFPYERYKKIGEKTLSLNQFSKAVVIFEQARNIEGLQKVLNKYWDLEYNSYANELFQRINEIKNLPPVQFDKTLETEEKLIEKAKSILKWQVESYEEAYEKVKHLLQKAASLKIKKEMLENILQ